MQRTYLLRHRLALCFEVIMVCMMISILYVELHQARHAPVLWLEIKTSVSAETVIHSWKCHYFSKNKTWQTVPGCEEESKMYTYLGLWELQKASDEESPSCRNLSRSHKDFYDSGFFQLQCSCNTLILSMRNSFRLVNTVVAQVQLS